ncbi:alpha/beta hydrolase [Pseudanabaena sp. PCC 6802]|uniref:alpha/beta hydrolase n=1 Tax=Pseudanabaena sp. PCC 6802 TaxID=118173 RepID=UPI000348432F|nr:alpha/beta hydrolase [Pseudanabaena sp. PCC 6802]
MPDFILFAQHGWADTNKKISQLAHSLATPETLVIAPDLGWVNTWLRIEPLIAKVEKIAADAIAAHPHIPIRIIGHSMGGLIWLEILDRHREWWTRVHSLVLVGSPVGGSDLGRTFDPLGWGIGIARDLGKNRRNMATAIAASIPTLSIAGDSDSGSDGTVPIFATQFDRANSICIPNLKHADMKNHPAIAAAIHNFWERPAIAPVARYLDLTTQIVRTLQAIPGITDTHPRGFAAAKIFMTYPDGSTIRIGKNYLQVDRVYVGDPEGNCSYSGYVGWIDSACLWDTFDKLNQFRSTRELED